jgi:hypothetical protein
MFEGENSVVINRRRVDLFFYPLGYYYIAESKCASGVLGNESASLSAGIFNYGLNGHIVLEKALWKSSFRTSKGCESTEMDAYAILTYAISRHAE